MRPTLLHELLEASAARSPGALAVVDGSRTLTYAELESRANRVAHLLVDLGVSPGDRVGLYLEKSLEAVVGIYGVLKSGAAYVPLDPHAPPARIGYIASDCGLRVLLSGREKAATLPAVADAHRELEAVVLLNGEPDAEKVVPGVRAIGSAEEAAYPESAPRSGIVSLDLAYILYTSGSTGTPKGVMLSHLNSLAFVEWAGDCVAVQGEDRLSSHAPLHFDLSVFDLFAAVRGGAAVVLVPSHLSAFPRELGSFIADGEISIWYSVPSALTALTLRGGLTEGALPRLRAVLFAGEVFPPKHLARLMELLPEARFLNLFGPTETNACTYYELQRPLAPGQEAIPIGKAIDGVDAYAILEDGSPAATGEIGELCVRGPTVMQGYWGDPDRSARSLGAPLRAEGLRTPAYRTGDLVRRDEHGDLWFLGRRDAQVKSRGYRIELGEIEATLLSHPAVTECAVLAVPDELITNRIVAFVGLEGDLEPAELARHCALSLPRYMVPEIFEFMTSLPKTSTGKVDRQSLLAGIADRSER
ncbi:MAG TPA: amino acid adenylation domain-containing protein [Gaiellaceae bacterium]|nr:amino acid adenylation domain-containing protein [Gaiellaceae bacterium]